MPDTRVAQAARRRGDQSAPYPPAGGISLPIRADVSRLTFGLNLADRLGETDAIDGLRTVSLAAQPTVAPLLL